MRATDNIGQTARFEYDSRDNLVQRSDAQGAPVADPLNLFPRPGQSGQINQPGNTVRYVYDGLDRMIQQIQDLRVNGQGGNAIESLSIFNSDGQIALSYRFDGNSRLTAIIDDKGNTTSFIYDALNRKTRHINADLKEFNLVYDRDDNVRQVTDPNNSIFTSNYDALHRLTQTTINRGVNLEGTTQCTYEYDGASRLTRCVDHNGGTPQTVERVYDSLSRLLEERQNGRTISNVFSGDSKRLSCVYPGGRTITAAFDTIDRVSRLSDQSGIISECLYIGPGLRELERINGNGTKLSYLNAARTAVVGYDGIQRLVRMQHQFANGQAFIDHEYAYNRASMRVSDLRHDDFGQRNEYTYDSVYRVTQSQYDLGGTGGGRRDQTAQTYSFDGVGNRRSVQIQSQTQGPVTEEYSVNEMNEYTSKAGVNRLHDDNGNLFDNGRFVFVYDAKNRLVRVISKTSGANVAQYLYDCGNRRTRKIVYSQTTPGQVESDTLYFYDGWQVCEEQNAAGQTQITYVYGSSIDVTVRRKI